jgi:hypothetical protein
MTTLQQAAPPSDRLAPVRRTYIYIVAFISLAVTLSGIGSLVDTLLRLWLDSGEAAYGLFGYSRGIASSAGLLLVATPIFLIHWGLAQRHRNEAGERASLLRKAFLYAASAWSLVNLLLNIYLLIDSLAATVLGAAPQNTAPLAAQWGTAALLAAVHAALLAYWYTILQSDGDFGAEATTGRIVRQIFMLLAGLAGLALLLWGAANALAVGLRLLVDAAAPSIGGDWWRSVLASTLAQVLVGGWLAYNNRNQWRTIVAQHPGEGQAALRRLYLYAAVVIGAVATLTPAALLLRELLLMLFGDSTGSLSALLNKLVTPLSYVPVGLVIWLWHWNVLRREAAAFGESHQGATVRRIYYYLMAATGLALLWAGNVELLNALIDTLFNWSLGPSGIWHEPLANGLSLLLVGAPIWAMHWRSVQSRAERTDAEGAAERDALPRKIYLYGVSLVAALILLFQLAQVIYRLLLLLMGDASAPLFSSETAHQLAGCLIAGVFWGVHLLAIRNDGRLEKITPAAAPAPALGAAQRRQALEQRRQALAAELAQIDQALAALPSEGEA